MKIICVEEHATDPATDEAARPAVLGEAPYFGLMDSPAAASAPRNDHRPTMVALPEALELAADIGDGRIKHMDEQGIQMQVVSYGSLAQLTAGDQAVALTQTANNRLAEAITDLGLDVETVVGGHRGTDGTALTHAAPLSYLKTAAGL